MPLPIGAWKLNVNGTEVPLFIESPNQQGIFDAQLLGIPCAGFWDEVSQTITFVYSPAVAGFLGPNVAVFKGYLFRSPPNPQQGQDVLVTLAGSVQVSTGDFTPAISTSRRNVFGWFAQIPEVI